MNNVQKSQKVLAAAHIAIKTAERVKKELGFNAEVLIINTDNKKEVTAQELKEIIKKCCTIWQVEEKVIFQKVRKRDIVAMRSIVHHLLRTTTTASLKLIAKSTGGLDHTSVMHSIENVKMFTANNDSFINQYFLPIKHLYNDQI